MNDSEKIRVLVVEDDPGHMTIIRNYFESSSGGSFEIESVDLLSKALDALEKSTFDAVLLDMGLPDSQGEETFLKLHKNFPDIPVLVLTGNEDENQAVGAIRGGAEDYIGKSQLHESLLNTSIVFAVERNRLRKQQEQRKHQEVIDREMLELVRLSTPETTAITARMYSGSPLSEIASAEFKAAVSEFLDLLDLALEKRAYKTKEADDTPERLRDLGIQIGFLRGGARDVVDIHIAALKKRVGSGNSSREQAFLEEGRLMVLELMGHLASYYRSFYNATERKDIIS